MQKGEKNKGKTQHIKEKLYRKKHRLMNIFLYKTAFNWGKEN